MVKVSICIPTYNNADEVKQLLESIFEQEYRDFEVNISDDSTNEEIAMVVKGFHERYGEAILRYIHNEKRLGYIFNWNAAINMANGEYIKIMFSDDWFTDSKCLGKFVRMLDEQPEALLAFSGSRQVMLDDSINTSKHKKSYETAYDRCASTDFIQKLQQDYRNLFLGNEIGAPSAVIYRKTSEKCLFDERSNWASDMFLYFEILQRNNAFAYTTEPLICIGEHANQYTETFLERDERIYQDYRYMYEKYKLHESKMCKEYFAKQFLVKYHKGLQEARVLDIGIGRYIKCNIMELLATVYCFVGSRFRSMIQSEKEK